MPQTASDHSYRPFTRRSLLELTGFVAIILVTAFALGHELVLELSGFFLSCGFVVLIAFALIPVDRVNSKFPSSAILIFTPILYSILILAFFLFGEVIDQPHPIYLQGNWITVALSNFLPVLPLMFIAILILVALDAVLQQSHPRDVAYYPRMSQLRGVVSRTECRLTLAIGVLLVLGYYTLTSIDVWEARQRPATIWPPKRVFVACNFLWGFLWLADCLARPKKGTIAAAIGFLVLVFVFLSPMGFGVLRE